MGIFLSEGEDTPWTSADSNNHTGHLGPRENLELKARDPDPPATLSRARSLGACEIGLLVQCDTFFNVTHGRLKLREETPGEAHLIFYERPNCSESMRSRYRVMPVSDPHAVKRWLHESEGTGKVVRKFRRLLLFENVRIHIDQVESLGCFVELEAVAAPGANALCYEERLRGVAHALGISAERQIACAYADLL